MDGEPSRKFLHELPLYVACYALWLGLSALGVWLMFETRPVLFDLGVLFRLNPWQVRAIDQFSIVIFGLIWLVGFFLLEHYLRQGLLKHRMWRRAGRVFAVEAAGLALCYGIQALLG